MIEPVSLILPKMITGCTYEQSLTVKVDGVAKSLANCVIEIFLYKYDTLIDTLTIDRFLEITAESGVVSISIPEGETSKYPLGSLSYRLEIVENNTRFRYLKGALEVCD